MRYRFLAVCPLLALAGCTKTWDVQLTEVGKHNVELYLNAPAGESFSLRGMKLTWAIQGGGGGEIDLGVLPDPLNAGEFLVVWERNGYAGPPVAEDYVSGAPGPVKGIKVADNLFDTLDTLPAMVQVEGVRSEALLVRHKAADGVRFGMPVADRPQVGPLFTDDGSLFSPTGAGSVQRVFSGGAPRDTNHESDWKNYANSFGAPTP